MRFVLTTGIAGLLVGFSAVAIGDAKLLNFEAKHRVPGEYYVVLKTEKELTSVPQSGPDAPSIAPHIVPRTERTVRLLAEALAKRIGARCGGVVVSANHRAFIVKGASDQTVRSILSKDPRIAEISPGIETTVD